MRLRAILLFIGAMLVVTTPSARSQSIPLGGVDMSGLYSLPDAASRNKAEDVKVMLAAGKNPDVADDTGQTPLGYASSFGNLAMVQSLLAYHAPVDRRDGFGSTPLHWAAQRGTVDVLNALIAAQASIDLQNKQGITPLMLAASNAQVAAVRILMQHGADPNKQDYTGRDAVGWANGRPNVLQALKTPRSGG